MEKALRSRPEKVNWGSGERLVRGKQDPAFTVASQLLAILCWKPPPIPYELLA